MIHLFNRKLLLVTAGVKHQAEVRDILEVSGIEYRVRVESNIRGSARGRSVTPGTQTKHKNLYVIYVKKDDYEKARYLTRR